MAKKPKPLPKGISRHRGSLRISFTPPGQKKMVKRVVCPDTRANVKYAELKQAEVRLACIQGTFDWEKHFPSSKEATKSAPTELTISQAFDSLFSGSGRWKHHTVVAYESRIRTITRLCGDLKLKDVTPYTAMEIQNRLAKDMAISSVNALMRMLKKVFNEAVRVELLDRNPFTTITALREDTNPDLEEAAIEGLSELQVYTVDEATKLIAAAPTPWSMNMLTFLFWTGVRHGEASALMWKDIDLEAHTVVIRRTALSGSRTNSPKTGKARIIHLPEEACAALRRQREYTAFDPSGRVWLTHSQRKIMTTRQPVGTYFWKKLCKKAGLRYLVPYTTRHSFASWMLMSGESEMKVANHLGHTSVEMVRKVYGHFIPKKTPKWTLNGPGDSVSL